MSETANIITDDFVSDLAVKYTEISKSHEGDWEAIKAVAVAAAERALRADDDILFSAYLGIGILRNMTRAAGLKLAQERSEELLLEMDAAHPGLAARSALR